MSEPRYLLTPIGRISSPLVDLADAPAQGDEGAPEASVVRDLQYAAGLAGLRPGDSVIVVTWLDRADRSVMEVLDLKPVLGPVWER